jgi:hypothetical protein
MNKNSVLVEKRKQMFTRTSALQKTHSEKTKVERMKLSDFHGICLIPGGLFQYVMCITNQWCTMHSLW